MSLFDQIAGALGGMQGLERFTRGEASVHDPNSADGRTWSTMLTSAPHEQVQASLAEAAQRVDPQEFDAHITPGVGGTDPLGGLGKGALAMIAGSLLRNFTGGGGLSGLIPGLRTTDPERMESTDVASLARYVRQQDPQAFGRAAAEVGRQQPNVLQSLLGNKALMLGAAVLAAKVMSSRHRAA